MLGVGLGVGPSDLPVKRRGEAGGGGPTATRKVAVANAFAATTTGIQEITTVDLGGLTPKGAIIIYGSAGTDKDTRTSARRSVGVTDGTNQWGSAAIDEDAVSFEDVHRGVNITWLAEQLSITGAVLSQASFDSFVPNGIRINWSTMDAGALAGLLTVILFAGDDVSVAAGVVNGVSTTAATINVGFQPNAVIFAGSQSDAYFDSDSNAFRTPFGWAVDQGTVVQSTVNCARGVGGNAESIRLSEGDCQLHMTETGSTVRTIDVTAFGATGFNIQSTDTVAGLKIPYFAIKIVGASFKYSSLGAKTGSAGTLAKTGAGFQPNFGLFMSTRGVTLASPTSTTQMGMGIHAVDANLNHGGSSFYSISSGTTQADSINSNTAMVQAKADGVIATDCTVQSWDADGFTLNYTVVDTSDWFTAALLIGGLN